MAQPPGDVRTDSAKGAGTEAPVNPLYVQIANDMPQQGKGVNKTTASEGTLPGMSLFDKQRNDIPAAEAALPVHDFTRRQLMFQGIDTRKCHQSNSGQDYRPLDNFNSLDNFFKKGSKSTLLEDALKPTKGGKPGTDKLTEKEYKELLEFLGRDVKKPEKPAVDGNKVPPVEEVKVQPKTEPKTEAKVEPKAETKTEPKETVGPQPQEKKAEEQKLEEKKPEVPKVVEVPLTAFEQSIKNTGAFTVENVSDAYKAAAKDKTGVALVIVGENTTGSKELLEKLPQMQAQHPDLKFVVVNKDKLDERLAKNPADEQAKNWKAWVEGNLKDCHGQPINYTFTSVQTLKADGAGKPVPEKVTSTHWGANIESSLADQSRFAAAGTARNAGDFKFESKPEAPAKVEESLKPISVFRPKNPADAVAFIEKTRPQLYGEETTAEGLQARQEKYLQAIAVADRVNPEYLSKQKQEVKEEIEKENSAIKANDYERSPSDLPYDTTEIDRLNKSLKDLEYLEKAPSMLRAAMGSDLMYRGNIEQNQEKQTATKQLAQEILRNAIKADPELAKNDDFDFHLFNLKVDTAKLAQEAPASTQLSADQINQKLKSIAQIGVVIPQEKAVEPTANLPKNTDMTKEIPALPRNDLPKTSSCPKIERSVSNSCSGESRACNAATQTNCQRFCQPLRQGNCHSRRPLLNFLGRRR